MRIEYGVNEEPERWGYDLLGLPYPHGVAEAFPVVRASVEYEGEGYGAVMAWIQIIRCRIADGEEQIEVDKPPQLRDANMPHCSWGPNPSFFDAPSMAYDDAVMSKIVRPICGFRWGYKLTGGKPEPHPLAETPTEAWPSAREFLAKRYAEWKFEPE